MIFEEFLKDTRKELGISQKILAEKSGTTFQNISSYERHKTTCSFDVGMELLNALGVAVVIENNQIILKGDYKNMSNEIKNKVYKKEELDFINFNVNDIYNLQKSKILEIERISEEENKKALDKLAKNGYLVYFSNYFNHRLWDANHYPVGKSLLAVTKGDRRIDLVVSGGVHIEYFLFEEFIKDIKINHKQEGSFIEKVLMYECVNNDRGNDIFDIFNKRKDISFISPLLSEYEDIINDTLDNNDYIYRLYNEYDPRKITISDMLGMYDHYSSNYPYYAYKMPDGKIVLEDQSFEGPDIWDALGHIEVGFDKIYDYMLEEYETFPEGFVEVY